MQLMFLLVIFGGSIFQLFYLDSQLNNHHNQQQTLSLALKIYILIQRQSVKLTACINLHLPLFVEL